ncbi:MAG TPA: HAMP domain-containing protein [Candidatus Mediterraneibacter caccavium]|uniref:histidine kinase n=1 Tax=Candidatus Mediterraneibacter caccavium TaxID=2838661 RepID=A0A9D2AU33_9FIRM|nr:HAMP domain-containing protein [Candidatus Mediterraneibacter caccavium]
MYIQSGEWVIISRVKRQFTFRDKIFKNMRFRFILFAMLAGLLPCLAALFGIVKFYESRAVELRTAEIQNQCTILCNQLNNYGYLSDTSSEVINSSLTQLTNIYNGRVMVIDKDLRVVKDTYSLDEGKTDVSENVVRCMKGERTNFYDRTNHYIEVTSPIVESGGEKVLGVMLASVSTDNIETTKQVLYTHGGVIVGIAMILLAMLSVFLADRMVRPIHKITGAIENVTEGYSDDVLHVDTFTETRQLSEAFNKMLGRLKILDESREEFVSNVSHELKTPMTSMKVLADSLLEQDNVPVEMYQEFMQDIAKEIDRENQIITDLLSLVKMDRSGQTMNIRTMNINDLLEQILKRLKPIAEKKNVEMVMETFRPVNAEIDETKFTLAVSNLVENAIKYNHENGWVHVSLNADHKYFYVKVEDSGIGIPEQDQAHIFERFYRVDKSHSREIGGTGLGLAIARNAVLVHRGSIKVYSNEGEGTTFTVRIPLIYVAA